jgi:glutamine synthetase
LATSDANPYLAIAAALVLAERGLQHPGALPPPVVGNGFQATGQRELRFGFEAAVDRLAALPWAADALGEKLVEVMVKVKRAELRHSLAAITDWEIDTYGTML